MLKVMIVDDDYLVRQGFIRIMPWEKFNIEVAGEASNGVEALELLESVAVDLLITDLAMPVMSGLELMKRVKERYPHIFMVVLTFHHDFDLIRNALRLGALDYITKIELEEDQMEFILQRIVHRIGEQTAISATDAETEADHYFQLDYGYSFTHIQDLEAVWTIEDSEGVIRTDASHPFDQVLVKWHGVKGMKKTELLHKLHQYGEHVFFYNIKEGVRSYELPIEWLSEAQHPSKEMMIQLGMDWRKFAWMMDREMYAQLLKQTSAMRLPVAQLEQILYMAMEEWSKYLDIQPLRLEEQHRPQTWEGWVNWLEAVRDSIHNESVEQAYSVEIAASIMKAVDYMKQDLKQDIQLPAIARKVGMSRSYFSRCFRDIVGSTFQDYVRDVRIRHAKTLLSQTNRSVSWIASESGYPNERYFSKVFRQITGMLPRDYRKANSKVTNRPR